MLGEGVNYQSGRDLNRATYEVGIDGRRELTTRVSGRAGALYRTILSSELGAIGRMGSDAAPDASDAPGAAPDAAQLPLSLARSAEASAGLGYRLSPFTTGTTSVGYTRVTFASPLLYPGTAITASSLLSRRYSSNDALILSADLQAGSAQGSPLSTQTMAVGWQPATRWISARFLAGATRSSDSAAVHVTPSASADARLDIGPGGLSVRYARGVSQAFGLGQLLVTDQAGAELEYLTTANVVRVAAIRLWSSDPIATSTGLTTTSATVDVRHMLRSGLTLGSQLFYRERKSSTQVFGSGVHFIVAYLFGAQ
jgi:hypothetical protein